MLRASIFDGCHAFCKDSEMGRNSKGWIDVIWWITAKNALHSSASANVGWIRRAFCVVIHQVGFMQCTLIPAKKQGNGFLVFMLRKSHAFACTKRGRTAISPFGIPHRELFSGNRCFVCPLKCLLKHFPALHERVP